MKGLAFTLLTLTSSSAILTLSSNANALTSDPSTNYCYVTLCAGETSEKTYFEEAGKDNDNNRTFKISKGWNYKKLKETYTLPTPHNINRTQDDEGYYFAYWSNDGGRHEVSDDFIISDDITFTAKYYIDIKGEDKWKTDTWAKISQVAEKGIDIDGVHYLGLEALVKYYKPDGNTFVPRYFPDEYDQKAEIEKKKRSVKIKQVDGKYKNYDVICVAENHDQIYNYTGNLEVGCLTFQFVDILKAGVCYDYEIEEGTAKTFSYENSFIKKYIENLIMPNFEDDLKDSMQTVKKTVAKTGTFDDDQRYEVETNSFNAKLYLPSSREASINRIINNPNKYDKFNCNSYYENNQFDYQYQMNVNNPSSYKPNIKNYNNVAMSYYTRSLTEEEPGYSRRYPLSQSISESGYNDQYSYSGSSTYGVCPCFTIGIDKKNIYKVNNLYNDVQITADPFYSNYAYCKNEEGSRRNFETYIQNLNFNKGQLQKSNIKIVIHNPDDTSIADYTLVDDDFEFNEDPESTMRWYSFCRSSYVTIKNSVLATHPGDININIKDY